MKTFYAIYNPSLNLLSMPEELLLTIREAERLQKWSIKEGNNPNIKIVKCEVIE